MFTRFGFLYSLLASRIDVQTVQAAGLARDTTRNPFNVPGMGRNGGPRALARPGPAR
jgi:hypothetical protein